MLPPIVSVDDLKNALPSGAAPVDAELARAVIVCDKASALIRHETRRSWIVNGAVAIPDEAQIVFSICLDVAVRMWTNPTAARSESVGPFQTAHGAYLTEEEAARLRRFQPTGGLFTIATTRGEFETTKVDEVVYADGLPGEPMLAWDTRHPLP